MVFSGDIMVKIILGAINKYGGIDQLKNIITTIQNKPLDRRMILLAWNPKDNSKMALPPCHCIAHFDVSAKNKW